MTEFGVVPKTYNHVEGFLGEPNTGKSFAAILRARQMRDEPARPYIVGHDPTGSYLGPDIVNHISVEAARRGLMSDPTKIHVLDVADGGEVVRFGLTIALKSQHQAGYGRHHPVVCVLDEMVSVEGADTHKLDDMLRQVLARRRHFSLAVLWTTQSVYFVHKAFIGLCTRLYLFRLTQDADLSRLSRSGIPKSWVAKIQSLPDRAFILYEKGRPLTQDPPILTFEGGRLVAWRGGLVGGGRGDDARDATVAQDSPAVGGHNAGRQFVEGDSARGTQARSEVGRLPAGPTDPRRDDMKRRP